MIYLDNAATTSIRREVMEAMWPYLTAEFGNPSSHHALGETAAKALSNARKLVAESLGCRSGEVVFTSGGTEASNLAIKGVALAAPRGRHIVTSSIEHEAVLESCDYLRRHHGFAIHRLTVDRYGLVDIDEVRSVITPQTTLCSIMLANNEVGSIQPIAEIAAIAHMHDVPMHTDAVQAAGVLDLNVATLGVDALSLSGHKLGASKGIGVLYARGRLQLEPVLHGGGQERGRRSGTENVAAAVGFAVALRIANEERVRRADRLVQMRDALIADVLRNTPESMLTGHPAMRLPGLASFCFPGTSGESVLLQLEERGITCSSGSACAAGSDDPSHVLVAMGIDPAIAQTAVRFSLNDSLSEEEIAFVGRSVAEACASIRNIVPKSRVGIPAQS